MMDDGGVALSEVAYGRPDLAKLPAHLRAE